jgi:predicted DNA-binding transcriptional regulator AlpA
MTKLPLLDTDQLAEILPVTADTLRFWRHMGKGPKYFKLGGKKVFYRQEDVDAWMAEQYENSQYENSNKPVHAA